MNSQTFYFILTEGTDDLVYLKSAVQINIKGLGTYLLQTLVLVYNLLYRYDIFINHVSDPISFIS